MCGGKPGSVSGSYLMCISMSIGSLLCLVLTSGF